MKIASGQFKARCLTFLLISLTLEIFTMEVSSFRIAASSFFTQETRIGYNLDYNDRVNSQGYSGFFP